MTLSQWWQILTLYEVILVWPLAFVTFLALLRAKTRRGRAIGAALLVVWFIPFIHRALGDVYFDYLCKHEAGEFIYRTVDNVEGILQMRPRDGSKDYFDRLQNADLPEDPWGHTNVEARYPWFMLGKYHFLETYDLAATTTINHSSQYHQSMKMSPEPRHVVARFLGYNGKELRTYRKEFDDHPRSTFGFTWRSNRGVLDRLLNVYTGEVLVKRISNDETLASMRGYFRVRPYAVCPSRKDDFFVVAFLEKVLVPASRLEVRE